ncbi:ATPase, partial [Trypanosoma cruzi]
ILKIFIVFFCFWGNHYGRVSFLLSLFNCLLLHSSCEGCRVLPPNCSTRTPTDTLMTTALCASPAARMRRGRDERRAEGAVTCGRATRACGAEHTFLPSCFVFFAARVGRHPQRHTHSHTLPPCFKDFFFFCFCFCFACLLPPCVVVEVGAVPHLSLLSSCASCCVDVPPCAPLFSFSNRHTHA